MSNFTKLYLTHEIFRNLPVFSQFNILQIILVQGFCPLRIKITQFPGGSRLKMFTDYRNFECFCVYQSCNYLDVGQVYSKGGGEFF